MCCLFGIIDCQNSLSGRQKARMLSTLATECEARGTDATGIAYVENNRVHIYKRPLAAHRMRFYIPNHTKIIMGHTRMTTQGSEEKNCNNHPFPGSAGSKTFALAHNGVLYNDKILRKNIKLPHTEIETDSFIAVQLIEKKGTLTFDSLKYMAEKVEGSFAFTVLSQDNELYFVKGDNPLCIYHFPKSGLYLYASTEEILKRALKKMPFKWEHPVPVEINCGDILRIDSRGRLESAEFDASSLWAWYSPASHRYRHREFTLLQNEYVDELKSVASAFGFSSDDIDNLIRLGLSPEEIEEFFYCGEL